MYKTFQFSKWAALFARDAKMPNPLVFEYNENGHILFGLCHRDNFSFIQKVIRDAREVKINYGALCNCTNKQQDELHGAQRRVMNKTRKTIGNKEVYWCTVCKAERTE